MSRKLHLHARAIRIPDAKNRSIEVIAPLADHMARSWAFFGLDEEDAGNPFEDFED